MYFEYQQYDEGTKTFKGNITWGANTFFGNGKQVFVLKFKANLKIIDNATVVNDTQSDGYVDHYEKYERSCVNGNNIIKYADKTVEEC